MCAVTQARLTGPAPYSFSHSLIKDTTSLNALVLVIRHLPTFLTDMMAAWESERIQTGSLSTGLSAPSMPATYPSHTVARPPTVIPSRISSDSNHQLLSILSTPNVLMSASMVEHSLPHSPVVLSSISPSRALLSIRRRVLCNISPMPLGSLIALTMNRDCMAFRQVSTDSTPAILLTFHYLAPVLAPVALCRVTYCNFTMSYPHCSCPPPANLSSPCCNQAYHSRICPPPAVRANTTL